MRANIEVLPQRDRVATSTPMGEIPTHQHIASTSTPISHRVIISAQSNEDIVDSPFEAEPFIDYDEAFWEDELSKEAPDIEFDSISDAEVYLYMESQPPANPCRANNDSQEDRDIWAEMEQNERMANIIAALDDIGLREPDIDNYDDGDVEMQMIIEQSLRENLDIVAEFAAQPTPPPYQPSEDLPTSQQSLATQAPITNLPRAISTMPLNTIPEQVERPTVVATAEQDMPPTYSGHSEMEWELVSQGSAVEGEGVIVPSSPPPVYSEDSGSDSDGYYKLF